MLSKLAYSFLIYFIFSQSAFGFWGFKNPLDFENKYRGKVYEFKTAPQHTYKYAQRPETLRFVFVSGINLYPTPLGKVVPDRLSKREGILYNESQVLLQEFVREILNDLNNKDKSIDFVLFGGNQVADNEYFELFQDIVYDLTKYSIPYYITVGEGESKGSGNIDKLIKEPFYLLKSKGTNIIVLNNVTEEIIPRNLPEEASRQYIWLTKTLKDLNETGEELFVFAYKPLDARTIAWLHSFANLNLRLIGSGALNRLEVYKKPELAAGMNFKSLQTAQKTDPVILRNSALSVYPCSYTVVERKNNGDIIIRNVPIGLEGIRKKARDELKSLGINCKLYEGN